MRINDYYDIQISTHLCENNVCGENRLSEKRGEVGNFLNIFFKMSPASKFFVFIYSKFIFDEQAII
jgi:hypothetical protein